MSNVFKLFLFNQFDICQEMTPGKAPGFVETDNNVPKTMSELTRNRLIPLELHEF